MNESVKGNKSRDITKIKNFLKSLGFICNSNSSAQNLIYTKHKDVVIIKNSKK